MNKVLLAVGLLSAGMAFGQSGTTRPSSTTMNTSNYNTTNTTNENSRNATMGTNSSTNRPTSTTGSSYNSSGSTTGTGSSMGTSGMSTGSYSNSSATGSNGSMSTGTSGSYNNGSSTSGNSGYGSSSSTPSTNSGSYNSMGTSGTSTTTPSTTGSYNSNGMGTSSTTGSYNTNSVGTGTSATTPSTTDYNTNSNTGTSVTTNSTYSTETTARPARTNDYKNFAYGIYVGVNTTKFKGEALDANGSATALTGRLGYQAGFFVRGGGRLYGQIGAEYFASSSNYFTAGQGQSAASIRDQINIKYIQVPVYVGYKLTESDRGISAVRVQLGVEYANQIGSTANQFGNLNDFQVKSGTFNGLGQLGFDAGPLFLDLTYHYGFSNAIQQNAGFAGSQRRILSASLGFKF